MYALLLMPVAMTDANLYCPLLDNSSSVLHLLFSPALSRASVACRCHCVYGCNFHVLSVCKCQTSRLINSKKCSSLLRQLYHVLYLLIELNSRLISIGSLVISAICFYGTVVPLCLSKTVCYHDLALFCLVSMHVQV